MSDMTKTVLIVVAVVAACALISFSMTSANAKIRRIGCRTAAGLFLVFGLVTLAAPLYIENGGRGAILWAAVMFAVAGWQWRLSTQL